MEQTIDPTQLQFRPSIWAAFIVFAVVFTILQRTIDALFRRWEWGKRHTPPWKYLYYLIEFIVVTLLPFTGAFAAMCFAPQLPLVDKVSVPTHASVADTYRDEIDDAVAGVQSKMTSLGWNVDSFVISDVSDDNGHIEALSRPELVRVQKEAAIAEARSNSAVEDEKQKTQREISLFQKETDIQVSQNTIETAEARARAEQSGPQAEAKARLEVVEAETELAQAQAEQREAELKTEKITESKAEAEAKMIQAQADADAIKLRSEAIAANNGIYIDAQIVEQLPALAEALAAGLADANLTVLGGSDALTDLSAKVAQLLPALRHIVQSGTQGTSLDNGKNA